VETTSKFNRSNSGKIENLYTDDCFMVDIGM